MTEIRRIYGDPLLDSGVTLHPFIINALEVRIIVDIASRSAALANGLEILWVSRVTF